MRHLTLMGMLAALLPAAAFCQEKPRGLELEKIEGASPRNIIFVLADDHRYDAIGFLDHPFLKTPHLDSLASGGAYFPSAFVTTSLCSPSRASILTGLFMHHHNVVDNNDLAPPGTIFFPQFLQRAGYETAFVGKWHMGGGSDAPRPGFDHWVSFRGQGHYYPAKKWKTMLNINGKRVPQKGYITDELTDYALEWLEGRSLKKPFFLFLSHKAVHARFEPARRHAEQYADAKIPDPPTQADTPENYRGKPMWVKNQRNSWHGVDFPYHSDLDVKEYYRNYCRTLSAVDDSVGRLLGWLREKKLEQKALLLYMGDNGFLFGEHGLIDKRNAYEESMRIPMLAHCPELFPGGTVVKGVVANIDIAATFLAAAGLKTPSYMDGTSFLDLASGKQPLSQWRQYLLYEYYWEWNFPHTPTVFALRGNRFKLIVYHGIWDTDELYDLSADPLEQHNLIHVREHAATAAKMRKALYDRLEKSGGMSVPFGFKRGAGANLRRRAGSKAAPFPPGVLREKNGKN